MEPLTSRGFHFHEGGEKWLARGVSYGPFRPNSSGQPFPEPDQVRRDFEAIAAAGANSLRLYEVPDDSLAALAAEWGLRLLIDIPWPKHLDVYGDRHTQAMSAEMVRAGVRQVREWPNLLGVMLGNEIPADLVRWAGPRRVRAFLHRLFDLAKNLAPDLPFGYANYPSAEYLRLGFFDFLGFNVYLHDPSALESYLIRLRHLWPETPLLLSEFGVDSQEHGREEQARLLGESLSVAYETGIAGAFVFSWTDEWHAGGFDMEMWSFGLVDREREPKPALEAVRSVFLSAPQCSQPAQPPLVSVVIATHNGARTLHRCLESLFRLRYPRFEIVVVDDGSTDETPAILSDCLQRRAAPLSPHRPATPLRDAPLSDFPEFRVLTQANLGLSAARNAGIRTAQGDVVAFTDSDCVADPDWLHHLVVTMERGGHAAVGGPNLTPPEDGLIARSISLAPGHATHVLLSSGDAEHIPGCNMAFRREALLSIGAFDPVFRRAGDDVDVIWRLQDQGLTVGFSTAAFVWHHRRATIRAYWRQQSGYGQAEALLLHKHPHRFNDRGQSLWRGTIYSREHSTLLGKPYVHYGVFGSAGYQCIYERPAGLLPHLVTSFEWWILCAVSMLVGVITPPAFRLALLGACLSLGTSAVLGWRKWSAARPHPLALLPVVLFLWITQPVVRGAARAWGRIRLRAPRADVTSDVPPTPPQRAIRGRVMSFWGEEGGGRLEVLRDLLREVAKRHWQFTVNSDWEPWDLSVVVSWWFKVRLITAEENHGETKRLLRVRLGLVPTSLLDLLCLAGILICGVTALQSTVLARFLAVAGLMGVWFLYRQACRRREGLMALVESIAEKLGHHPLLSGRRRRADHPPTEIGLHDGEELEVTR